MVRRRAQRNISKDQLALAVRKNFNGAAVNEVNVMVDMLYKVRHQGKPYIPVYAQVILSLTQDR